MNGDCTPRIFGKNSTGYVREKGIVWCSAFCQRFDSGAFAAFFGGTVRDLLVSALIGIVLKCTEEFLVRQKTNSFVTILLCSCLGGLLANLAVMAQVGNQVDMISLGNIILFIPGVVFVNSMRDMFSKDIVTGLVGFVDLH